MSDKTIAELKIIADKLTERGYPVKYNTKTRKADLANAIHAAEALAREDHLNKLQASVNEFNENAPTVERQHAMKTIPLPHVRKSTLKMRQRMSMNGGKGMSVHHGERAMGAKHYGYIAAMTMLAKSMESAQ